MIWRKSKHSATSNDCLEIAGSADDLIHIRDSKRAADPTLIITTRPAAWAAFLSSLRACARD
ncbi:DUF397 domain-containing protein [Streptomyces mobaraensis NBRC 13819 = DSM 40847]|uniref:Uncharacterized protein n=1 Tax=Streptomyces mobaraensis (strain ATCC 29032 / DSM 40847 / JCM 4168 / NBRC 13819 / NCIMB 11159 / IPCR 16-22) TaxID=1223523 RepID=M2ZXI2_STRM1|nr:DUF397 domain-containing protein [Streptomyces mobaraensis]EME97428.1 hypothetical protein H340_26524 [Streptomyces mobaraensis NBRC 13819 = DSM 40847]QTT72941.1 DUF397 domain-containing protein [Streptomyces mobaraensis NBRC 13819 = DSM 40847]